MSSPREHLRSSIPSRRGAAFAFVVTLGSLSVLTSCSNDSSITTELTPTEANAAGSATATPNKDVLAPGETRLTTAQASTFSKLLTKNRADQGASFVATVPYGPAATFTISGQVDWINYAGNATLSVTRSDGQPEAPVALAWNLQQMVQQIEGLEAAMEAKGRSGVRFTTRQINPKTSPLDRVIVLINSMSNERPENPILLRQRTDVAFVGTADLNGTALDRYRYGNTTYWVNNAGSVDKLVANFKDFAGPVEIVFSEKGAKVPTIPAPESVVAAAEVQDVLDQLSKIRSTGGTG